MRHRRIVRFSFYALIGITLAWLFIKDLNPSGILEISYDLCSPSPYISEFSPHGRVLDIERNPAGYCTQKMVIDPVYIDVRLPQGYDSAVMTLKYKKEEDTPLSFGVRTSPGAWQWDIKSTQAQERSKFLINKDWERASADFDISRIPLDRRRLRFMLSSPSLDESGASIALREVQFRFEKPALSMSMLKRWARSFLAR